MNERERCACLTGHRTLYEDRESIRQRLCGEIRALAAEGVTDFLCGGARGFDLLCGETVLGLAEELGIRLVLAVPYPGQERGYSSDEKRLYRRLCENAEVHVISERYHRYSLMKRNQFLVDHAKYCISYLRRPSGGTFLTVQYARMRHLNLREL